MTLNLVERDLLADTCAGSGDSRKGKEPASGPARRAEQKLDSVTSQWFDRLTRRCTTPRSSDGRNVNELGQKEERKEAGRPAHTATATGTGAGGAKANFPRPTRPSFAGSPSYWYRETSVTNQPNRTGTRRASVQPAPAPRRVTHRRRRKRTEIVRRSGPGAAGRLPVPVPVPVPACRR